MRTRTEHRQRPSMDGVCCVQAEVGSVTHWKLSSPQIAQTELVPAGPGLPLLLILGIGAAGAVQPNCQASREYLEQSFGLR